MHARIGGLFVGVVLAVAVVAGVAMPYASIAPTVAYAQGPCLLYGATGGSASSNLVILDPDTGAVDSVVGPIGFGVTGLAFDPTTDRLYGVTGNNSGSSPGHLIRIDTATGAGTIVGDLRSDGENGGAADITFRSDGTLFGWLEPGSDDLVRINTATGAASIVGDSDLGTFGSGLAFSNGGRLYFAGEGVDGPLRLVDPSNGQTLVVSNLSGAPDETSSMSALAFDPSGTMFGVALQSGGGGPNAAFLVTINPLSGAITTRGQSINRLDAIVFGCDLPFIPDPPLPVAGAAESSVNDPNNDDDEDEKPKETEEQRQQRERTNRGGRSDVSIEGNVLAVEEAPAIQSLLATIGVTRNERIVVQVFCTTTRSGGLACPDIKVGDYLEADGYQNGVGDSNNYFVAADGIEVWRNGKKVK